MTLSALRDKLRAGALTKQEFIAAASESHRILLELGAALRGGEIGSISVSDEGVVYELRSCGTKFRLCELDPRVPPVESVNFGSYEPLVWRVLSQLMSHFESVPGEFVDIGANIGWYSARIGKLFPTRRIVSIEPVHATFERLQANILLNGLTSVTAHCLALSDAQGKATMHHPLSSSVGSYLATLDRGETSGEEVDVTTLDLLGERLSLRPIVIKCDVEGGEFPIFKGGLDVLRNSRPVLVTEMLRNWSRRFNYHPQEMIDFLAGLGYRCWAVGESSIVPFTRMTEDAKETNFLFLDPTRHGSFEVETIRL